MFPAAGLQSESSAITTNAVSTDWRKMECWCYFSATQEAADVDLREWKQEWNSFDGVDGKRYQTYLSKLKELGKIKE